MHTLRLLHLDNLRHLRKKSASSAGTELLLFQYAANRRGFLFPQMTQIFYADDADNLHQKFCVICAQSVKICGNRTVASITKCKENVALPVAFPPGIGNDLKHSTMMILIAGPYRGGTNDDPVLIQKNLERLEAMALPLFRKGHIPMIGEWVALPLMHLAGFKKIGDSIWDELQYPVAHRLLEKCDAVLRIEGASKGADEDVRKAKERGLPIYYSLDEIPDTTAGE